MPLVGHLVDNFGQRFTFLVASAPLLLLAALCVHWLRRQPQVRARRGRRLASASHQRAEG
jgi:hypothetical protein